MGETAEAAQPPTRVGATNTGKKEDIDVGLTYFGKRYLSPYLNRWISADPLAVHVPGEADLNVYTYVSGQALKATDPLGLQAVCNPDNPQAEARRAGAYNARLDVTLVKDTEEAYRRYSARIPDGATAKEIESLHARFIAEVSYLADQNAAAKAAVPTNPELRKAYDEAYGPKFTYGVAFRLFQAVVENLAGAGRAGEAGAGRVRLPKGVFKEIPISESMSPKAVEHLEETGSFNRKLTGGPCCHARPRKENMQGVKTKPKMDRDEAPPAVFKESKGASVRLIPKGDNRSAGAQLGNGLKGVPEGADAILKKVK